MSALRRYIAAVIAVAVAFAAGIALGSGPLQGSVGREDDSQLASDNAALSNQMQALRQAHQIDLAVADQAADRLVQGRLKGSSVLIVSLPGASSDAVERMQDGVNAAGGQLVGTVHLASRLLNPSQKTYVESVVSHTRSSMPELASDSDTYNAVGQLLARAYVGAATGSEFDQTSTTIDGQLSGARLVDTGRGVDRRAGVVIIVDDESHGSSVAADAHHLIASSLIRGLVASHPAAVLVGSPQSTSPGGDLSDLPSDITDHVTVVNQLGASTDAVMTVLAAAQARLGRSGMTYGVVDGNVSLPPGLATS